MALVFDSRFCHREYNRAYESGNTAETDVECAEDSSHNTVCADNLAGGCAFDLLDQVCRGLAQPVSLQDACDQKNHDEDRHTPVCYEIRSDRFQQAVNAKSPYESCCNQRQENDEDRIQLQCKPDNYDQNANQFN